VVAGAVLVVALALADGVALALALAVGLPLALDVALPAVGVAAVGDTADADGARVALGVTDGLGVLRSTGETTVTCPPDATFTFPPE